MANTSSKQGKSRRGFAAMNPEEQREIASKGGKAAHAKGTAHQFTSAECRLHLSHPSGGALVRACPGFNDRRFFVQEYATLRRKPRSRTHSYALSATVELCLVRGTTAFGVSVREYNKRLQKHVPALHR